MKQEYLPLMGGGQTLPGYSTVFRPTDPPPKNRAYEPPRSPRITRAAVLWLIRLHKEGPQSWRLKRGKVQDDCIALGLTEWAKDSRGRFLYDSHKQEPRVKERLTDKGREIIDGYLPRRRDARRAGAGQG